MPTTFVKGDFLSETPLLEGARVYAFPAEATGKMDAGVSVAMRRRWPALGEWWAAEGGRKKQVGIAPAWHLGSDLVYAVAVERAGAKAKLSWLEGAVRAMIADAERRGLPRISVARLWGGPRGVDGARAKSILTDLGEASSVTLVVFEQFVRAREASEVAAEEGGDAAESDSEAADVEMADESPPKAPKKKAATKKAKAAAAQKPAAKKPAGKAPAGKTPATKKPAGKKPAAKTPATKTPAGKKPAAKTKKKPAK